ncbi:helix-turn-helix domain-containing protein [Corynebacterium sp.]|uniref:helix-turn-helix domain-containing protein n=1 Tax=Corynebacterium sp. TaxID=1720 RepID=UPI0028AEC445|nr:helix-turn-helix domain-containing protein [Corynebacterium sp.]
MELTTREAAARLGVSQARVRALINSGGLTARRVGTLWLIDAASIEHQCGLITAGATSRAMSPRVAWAAADLADGGTAAWLSATERSRLRRRLSVSPEVDVVRRWMSRRASSIHRYKVGPKDLTALLTDCRVVRTGISAVESYRLGLGTGGDADVYVSSEDLGQLVRGYVLLPTGRGNLTVRVDDGDLHRAATRTIDGRLVAPRMIAGADLADDTDARTRNTGRRLLTSVMSEQAWRR